MAVTAVAMTTNQRPAGRTWFNGRLCGKCCYRITAN